MKYCECGDTLYNHLKICPFCGGIKNRKPIQKTYHKGGYKYIKCPSCRFEIEIDKPHTESAYYCGTCGKLIENVEHSFCGWCGNKIKWEEETLEEQRKQILDNIIDEISGIK